VLQLYTPHYIYSLSYIAPLEWYHTVLDETPKSMIIRLMIQCMNLEYRHRLTGLINFDHVLSNGPVLRHNSKSLFSNNQVYVSQISKI
jgi:hypothetical protein